MISTFLAGNTAFAVGGPRELPRFANETAFQWRVAPLPVKDVKNIQASSATLWWIPPSWPCASRTVIPPRQALVGRSPREDGRQHEMAGALHPENFSRHLYRGRRYPDGGRAPSSAPRPAAPVC